MFYLMFIQSQTDLIPSKVIVMEYCNGGSLYSILEKPINAYGLEETEFLLFLKHICKFIVCKHYILGTMHCALCVEHFTLGTMH